jgi:DNA-binding transcriptional LysR family regulator
MPTRRRYEDIPIECLRAIVTIADQGSFRGATEVLGLSQPAISAQVRRLERLIGARVFEKSPRGVGLTERGKTVDRYARRILVLGDQIKAHFGASEGHVLRIGMQNFFVEKTLTMVIEKCSAAYVGGSIQFVCDVSSSIRNQLARGYLDLAFVIAPPDFPVPAHSEWTEKIVWAAAPGVRPAVDKSIPLIVLPGGNIDRIAIGALEQKGMSHTIAFSASDTTARKEAALARVGIMAAPERLSRRDWSRLKIPSCQNCRRCARESCTKRALTSLVSCRWRMLLRLLYVLFRRHRRWPRVLSSLTTSDHPPHAGRTVDDEVLGDHFLAI